MPRGTSDRDTMLLQGRLWTPQQIDNGTLLAWYDAMDFSTISATSGSVDSWRDKSRFGRSVANTGAGRPTFSPTGARGWPGLTCAATSQGLFHSTPYMFTACDTAGTGLTVTIVYYNNTTAGTMIGEASTASNNPIWAPMITRSGFQSAWQQRNDANTNATGSTVALSTGATFGTAAWTLQTNVIPAGSATVTTGRNFGIVGSTPVTRTYVGVYTLNSFSIPGYYRVGPAITNAPVGTICEVIIVAGTDTRIVQLVEGYLGWKWPTLTALNEDHPFVNRPPEIGQ